MTGIDCIHARTRAILDREAMMVVGVEICTKCGARRLVEADHDGPWVPAGEELYWLIDGERVYEASEQDEGGAHAH